MHLGSRLAVLVGVVLAANVAGCSQPNSPAATATGKATRSVASPLAQRRGSPYCTVSLPTRWSSALKARNGTVPPATRIGFAVAANGSEYFAESYSPAWSGVVEIFPATGRVVEIRQFADPRVDQVSPPASFDGHWFVWSESTTLQDPVPVTVMAWDSRTNTVVTVFNTPASALLNAFPVAYAATVAKGELVWVQGAGKQSDVHLYNLEAQTDRIIFRGRAGSPVFWGTKILFPVGSESSDHLVADSSRTGQPSLLPKGWARVRGVSAVALTATPHEVIWTQSHATSTWVWRPSYKQAEEVGINYSWAPQPLVLANSDFFWSTGQSAMVGDPRSGSMAVVPANLGVVVAANGNVILAVHALPGATKPQMSSAIFSVVDVAKLPPLPRCHR